MSYHYIVDCILEYSSVVSMLSLYLPISVGSISLRVTLILNPHIKYSAVVVFYTHSNFQPTILGVKGVPNSTQSEAHTTQRLN